MASEDAEMQMQFVGEVVAAAAIVVAAAAAAEDSSPLDSFRIKRKP